MSRNGNRSLSPEFDVFFNGHLVLALPKAFAFLRRVAKPLAAMALRFSSLSKANPLGTLAWPPFFPMEARYSLTGDRFLATSLS